MLNHVAKACVLFFCSVFAINAVALTANQLKMQTAIKDNQIQVIAKLVESGYQINRPFDEKGAALHYAIRQIGKQERPDLTVLKALIKLGADVSQPTQTNELPVALAISYYKPTILQALLDAGASPTMPKIYSTQPIMMAINRRSLSMVKILIEANADLTVTNSYDENAIEYTFTRSFPDEEKTKIIQMLLMGNIDINKQNNDSDTSLLTAVQYDLPDVVAVLINAGADVNIKDKHGYTALTRATQANNIALIKALLAANANPNIAIEGDWSPLHFTVAHGNDDNNDYPVAAQLLIDAGADLNVVNENNVTPLAIAARFNKLETLKVLLDNKADTEIPDKNQWTPLMWTSHLELVETTQKLLKAGANPNAQTHEGWAPLHFSVDDPKSVSEKPLQIVRLLLKHGANVNQGQQSGFAPLHFAAVNNLKTLSAELLNNGADYNQAADNGDTPLSLAKKHQHSEIIEQMTTQ